MNRIYIVIGTLFLILGIVGIFIPLLPTTPFLLLTAALYFKGSPKLYNRLINNKYIGTYIINYREHKSIPMRMKIGTLLLLWLSIGYCIIWVVDPPIIKIALGMTALAITLHILSFKTLPRNYRSDKNE